MRFNLTAPYKLFVRLPETGKFLKTTGRWTKRMEKAFAFANPLSAIHTCISFGLREVELVFHTMDGTTKELRLNCT